MALMPHWPLYLGPNQRNIAETTSRMKVILENFHNPQNSLKNIIHVTGTNGKGSVVNYICSILQDAGYKVGKYISPHIHQCNERISVNKDFISDEDLHYLVEEIRIFCELKSIEISIFECTTLVMLMYFQKCNCDFNVIEVGMGGLQDATNVFDLNPPICSIITPIDLDHTKHLGSTIEEIAIHKCAIIKPHSICISAMQEKSVEEIIKIRCEQIGTSLYLEGSDFHHKKHPEAEKWTLFLPKDFHKLPPEINLDINSENCSLVLPNPGLIGEHQLSNSSLAVVAVLSILYKYSAS